MKTAGEIIPQTSLDFDASLTAVLAGGIPNFNKAFDSVNGVDGSKVKWLVEANDRTEDDPVVLFFHGGGYVTGVLPTYYPALLNYYRDIGNDRLSILMLDYTLTKDASHPKQLQEAAAVYNTLTNSSKNIILEGDSSGGNLALILLRHSKYPIDSVEPVSTLPTGLMLYSPWVNLYPDGNNGTMASNYGKDILNANALQQMGVLFAPDEETRNSTALNQFKDYIDWSEVLPDPSKIFVAFGGHEVLAADIRNWANIAKLEENGAQVLNDTTGIHDGFTFTVLSNYYHDVVDFHKNNFS